MQYIPTFTKYSVIFDLVKPIYGSYFAIWQKWLDKAGDRYIVVNTKFGKATFANAGEYKSKAKRIKRYFKNPDVPMIFYALSFAPEIKEREERKKLETTKEEFVNARLRMRDDFMKKLASLRKDV